MYSSQPKLESGNYAPTSEIYLQILSGQDHNIRWHVGQKKLIEPPQIIPCVSLDWLYFSDHPKKS